MVDEYLDFITKYARQDENYRYLFRDLLQNFIQCKYYLNYIKAKNIKAKTDVCPICMDTPDNEITFTCQHKYCINCVTQLINNKIHNCSLCKTIFS